MKELLAQLSESHIADALFSYGPLGFFCLWLMFRTEKKLDGLGEQIVAELRVLGHRINGMTRAMLCDVASRESTGAAIRTLAQEELSKLEREDEVKDVRGRAAERSR